VPDRPSLGYALRVGVTLALSAGGGLLAQSLGMPAGWIAGGILTVAVASLAGVNTDVPRRLRPPIYLMIGIYAAGGVSQETLHQMQTWPASFAILGLSVIGVVASSYWWLHGRHGWERNDALLSSMPGALSFVMAAAEGLQADMKKVAISQSLRVLILVELIPLLALLIGHPHAGPTMAAADVAGPRDTLIMLLLSIPVAFLFDRFSVPGGWMLGGLLTSAALLLSGVVEGRVSLYVVLPFMIGLAAITGSRFRPGDMALIPHLAKPSLVAFVLAGTVSVIGAVCVTLILGVNIIQTLLAFAPGGLDALVIISFQLNVDPAYVAAHHVARFLALVFAMPLIARWLARRS
jgi:membrane AbrB-like protein